MPELLSLDTDDFMAEADNPVPKRVLAKILAVVVPCLLVPFILSVQISAFLWDKIIPFLMFGIEETRRQSIAITVNARGYVTFSNGVTVHGWKFVILELLDIPIFLVIFIPLSFILLRAVAWMMKRFDPSLSHSVLRFWQRNHDA